MSSYSPLRIPEYPSDGSVSEQADWLWNYGAMYASRWVARRILNGVTWVLKRV